ncbi:MAG: very short patch repair endonuclease [Verrucomicrobiota bacterium]|nr:very short patch repair endonuclease [Verrucomicrobiota bacterium]
MADVFTKQKRSAVMARIRSRGNRDTELALARLLRAHQITGWRRHLYVTLNRGSLRALNRQKHPAGSTIQRSKLSTKVTVRPDFVFPKQRVVIFVDGCFWHGCPIHSPPARWLRKSSMPVTPDSRKNAKAQRTGKRFWRQKLAANMARDRLVTRRLCRAGWRVIRIWEHELTRLNAQGKRLKAGQGKEEERPMKMGDGNTARLVRRIRMCLEQPP